MSQLPRFITPLFAALLVATLARATPAHDARVAALRATLARGGIGLEMRSVYAVVATAGCSDVVDRLQPDGCVRCTLADDRDATAEVLATITAALDRYSTDLLAQADIGTFYLCRRLEDVSAHETRGGISLGDPRRVMIAVSKPALVAAIVHHELFHMIESARIANINAHDQEWESANPIGFSYLDGSDTSEGRKPRPTGFVDWYAASRVREDRASTFEYMMAEPDQLCEIATNDPIARAKVEIIWSRMLKHPGGYDLMYGTAPCVQRAAGRQ
jgi:hypothetical protein